MTRIVQLLFQFNQFFQSNMAILAIIMSAEIDVKRTVIAFSPETIL